MSKRKVANPLALAVLACLFEKPMHPYEMASTMRDRHQDESIRLNYGSLYTVVQGLQRHNMIDTLEVQREGNRPERTIFRLTDAGRIELIDWLSELLCTPEREFTQFEAGLSLLPVLPPRDAVVLLRQRCDRIEVALAQGAAVLEIASARNLPHLFFIEAEFRANQCAAELAFTRGLIAEIEANTLDGLARWRGFHKDQGEQGAVLAIDDARAARKRDV